MLKQLTSKVILLVVLSLSLLFAACSVAAKAQFTFDINFKNIGKAQGLDNPNVLKVLQDCQGYIWVATEDGLYRFDGYGFKVFKHIPQDSTSLASNNIQHLYLDSKGALWVGAWQGGFARYHPQTESFTTYRHDAQKSNTLSNDEVTSIVEDPSGYLWIVTLGGGLNRYNTSTHAFTHFRHDPQGPEANLTLQALVLVMSNITAIKSIGWP